MNNIKISLCHYPTTTLFIDDNQNFLSEICLNLSTKDLLSKSYSDPSKALQFLNKEYKPEPFTNQCITTAPDREFDKYTSSFDVRKIHHEIYRPDRFKQFSVVVVDYAMPIQNGVDFCRELTEPFSLKMILTSEAGHSLAVEAFNEGLISKFLEKGNSHLTELLTQSVKELQNKYFLQLTDAALSSANKKLLEQAPACLSDPVFVEFFHKLSKDNHIVEYYLLDEHGSFLMLDANATPNWLIVKSEKDMKDVAEYAEIQNGLPDIVENLKSRKVVPYFHTKEDWNVGYDEEKCHRYLHPATLLKGKKETYYYSFIKDPNAYHLERDKIVSFKKFHAA